MGWFSCKQNCAIRVLEKQHHDCVIHIGEVNHLCVAFGAGTCTYTYASLSITSKVPNKQVAVKFVNLPSSVTATFPGISQYYRC